MFSKGTEKKKLSIDFEVSNHNLMTRFARNHNMTNSAIVNYLVEHMLKLSSETKKKFAGVSVEQLDVYKEIYSNCDGYEKQKIEEQISVLQDLILFFTDGKGYVENEVEKMNKIEIDRGYVIFPKDWIVVQTAEPKGCRYVGVIEVRNGKKYNVPHYLFFSEVPIMELAKFQEEDILSKCARRYPDFGRILDMQVEPAYDENKHMLNAELFMEAPTIGIFQVPTYGEDTSFPAGAMVVRTEESKNSKNSII